MTEPDDKDLFGDNVARVGAPLFAERWGNRKAFKIGVLTGQGLSAPSICTELQDGSTPNIINAMLSEWGHKLPGERHTYGPVKIMLSAKHRTALHSEAMKRNTDMAELCRQVLVMTAQHDMYKALLDP